MYTLNWQPPYGLVVDVGISRRPCSEWCGNGR
ncbi:Uncharacterised protein [Escherichia coli]|uniref:Uncharacterized protein n=1 Tax=Escherichia coli TaxID=562 RepID=A0A377CDE1_ECOLX|nr:Uncharacterised protein [Escherichia coli]